MTGHDEKENTFYGPDDHSAEPTPTDGSNSEADGIYVEGVDVDVDLDLAAAGHDLRAAAGPIDVGRIRTSVLEHRVARTRRTAVLAGAVAAIATVALIGIAASRAPGGVELAAPAGSEAMAIVDALGPEPVDPHEVALVATVEQFDSCDALLDDLRREGAAHVGSRGFGNSMSYSSFEFGDSAAAGSASPLTSDLASGPPASIAPTGETLGTNVIVEGVDEPDRVKASGTHVFDLVGDSLRVIDTSTTKIVATVNLIDQPDGGALGEGWWAGAQSMLLDDDRLVVFGNQSVPADPLPGDPSASRPQRQYLTITRLDISDPAAPVVSDRQRIEGRLVAARRVGGQVRMVTSSSMGDLPIVVPTTPDAVGPALQQNRLAVAGSSIDDWIPTWDQGPSTQARRLTECNDIVVPDTFAGVEMTSMVTFPMGGPFEPRSAGILAPAETVTATNDDVVVAAHVWVDPAEQTGTFPDWSTALHRFDTSGERPRYAGSGKVEGSIRDEFSLSVIDDDTVAAVTVDGVPWQAGDRQQKPVTVRLLNTDSDGARLSEVGSLQPSPTGGSLGGVRFFGDRLLVTSGFGGTVLSAIDLSDPAAPRELGSVGLPGSGEYIHPVGGDRALIVGRTLRVQPLPGGDLFHVGVHTTLVDLAAAPAVVSTWAQEGLEPTMLNDHHAFSWWPSRSVAAFPVSEQVGLATASRSAVVTVTDGSVTGQLVSPSEADLGPRCPRDAIDRSTCDSTGPPNVDRILVVDGQPWIHTSESLEALDPTTYQSVAVVPLRGPS
ncbi:MAG: beta-propeller domain-containing protein [Acidimicrobiales bacterium]